MIGRGTYGVVRKVQRQEDGAFLALKTIRKASVPDLALLQKEVQLLQQMDHPHIIRLFDVLEDDQNFHLITELCTGGELYDQVVEYSTQGHHFSEYDAARILRNILDAIQYCHAQGIVHRDLKVENFLLLTSEPSSPVKIIDFGLSRQMGGKNNNTIMTSRVGTVYYVAPEVLTQASYTEKCDLWSIGIVAYVLLCGFPPFYDASEVKTLQLVKEAEVEFPSPSWDDVSLPAKQFILRLLDRNVETRPTAQEALQDPWLHQPEVQPAGLARQASFRSDATTTTTAVVEPSSPFRPASRHHIQMKTPQRSKFHQFLKRIKFRKQATP